MTVAKGDKAAPYCHRVHADLVKATLAVDGSAGTGWWQAATLLGVAELMIRSVAIRHFRHVLLVLMAA
jgi:hypothetical protein